MRARQYFSYVMVSGLTMFGALYLTAEDFGHRELEAVLMYLLFMVGHYLYAHSSIENYNNNQKRRSSDNELGALKGQMRR